MIQKHKQLKLKLAQKPRLQGNKKTNLQKLQQIQHHNQTHWTINTPQHYQTTTSNTIKPMLPWVTAPKPRSVSKNKEKKKKTKSWEEEAFISRD